MRTAPERLIAELAVLHEISSFEFLDCEAKIARSAIEKASRLFGARCLALLRETEEGPSIVASWGFRNPAEIAAKIGAGGANQFYFTLSDYGILFIEQSLALTDQQSRLYNIFAREVEKALMYAQNLEQRIKAEEEIRRLNARLEGEVWERTRQLVEAQEELVRKEKLAVLGQLAGSVGHELRNPLAVISNAVYFLKTLLHGADDTTKEYLEIINQEIANSLVIISDLLDFARTRTPQPKRAAPGELVKACLAKCPLPEEVALLLDIPQTVPEVMVDLLQMRQVLGNLVTNALQAMPGGGSLTIAVKQFEQDLVRISIADTGEGMSPERMEKLFTPLFTTKIKGIGLGLVVCRNLVEANGGRIEVESREGEGSTFSVLIPAAGEGNTTGA